MSLSDPIADFLTRIRNAARAKNRYVDVRWSKMKQNIADVLKKYHFIDNYLVKHDASNRGTMRIFLRYQDNREPVLKGIKRLSSPGLRRYIGHDDIPHFYGGMSIMILSTSEGVLSGIEARKRNIGGELVCQVW